MQKQTIPLRVLNGPAAPPAGAAQKFWNIVDVSDEEAEITMYGEVVSQRPTDWWTGEPVEGLYITPEGFLEDRHYCCHRCRLGSCYGSPDGSRSGYC